MDWSGSDGQNPTSILPFLGKIASSVYLQRHVARLRQGDCQEGTSCHTRFGSVPCDAGNEQSVRPEVKQLKADGYEPVLKGSRWLLLKRPENLTDKQAVRLKELLRYNLQSVRSHLMKEDFQRFWKYHSPTWAGKFLDAWCTRAMRSKIEPMKKMAKTLRKKRDLLLNWFRADGALSAGIVEGFNNKLKLITRKSYGFRTQDAYETALYHNLGALPEPEFTHRFC